MQVKASKEELEVIDKWPNKEVLLKAKVAGLLEEGVDAPIIHMDFKRLVQIIYLRELVVVEEDNEESIIN